MKTIYAKASIILISILALLILSCTSQAFACENYKTETAINDEIVYTWNNDDIQVKPTFETHSDIIDSTISQSSNSTSQQQELDDSKLIGYCYILIIIFLLLTLIFLIFIVII